MSDVRVFQNSKQTDGIGPKGADLKEHGSKVNSSWWEYF